MKTLTILLLLLMPFLSKGTIPEIDKLINKTLDTKPIFSSYTYIDTFHEECYIFRYDNMEITIYHTPQRDFRTEERWQYHAVYKNGKFVFLWDSDLSNKTIERLQDFCCKLKK